MKVRQIGLQALGLLARKGFLGLSFLLIARVLGPTTFGDFSYLYTWMYMFALIASLGFSPISTREVARTAERAPEILYSTLVFRSVASVIAIGLLILFFSGRAWGRPELAPLVLLLALSIPALGFAEQFGSYVMGFSRNAMFAAINLLEWGLYFGTTAVALVIWKDLRHVLMAQLTGLWCAVIVCAFLVRSHLRKALSLRCDWTLARFLICEAAPLALTNLLGVLYFRIGTLQLYHLRGSAETGLYTASLQVLEALQLIPMAVTGAMFPAICRAVNSRIELGNLFRNIVATLAFISLFIAATGSVLSARIVTVLFGTKFTEGGLLLSLLIWAAVPTFMGYTFAYFLIAANKQKVVTLNALIGVVVSFTFNLLLIPRYGALGAVYASIVTECSICLMHLVFVVRCVRVGRDQALLGIPVAGAAGVMLLGGSWRQANATVFHAVAFGLIALALFTTAFLFYRRLERRWTAA